MRVEKTMKNLLERPEGKSRPLGRTATSVFTKRGTFLGYLNGFWLLSTRRTSLLRGCVEILLLILDVLG